MGNHFHPSKPDAPVLPSATSTLPAEDAVADAADEVRLAPTSVASTEPRPIVISPNSKLSMSLSSHHGRPDAAPHSARTTPIAAPTADMTTPAGGIPRLAPALPTLPTTPTSPTVTAATAASPVALVAPELVEVVAAVVEAEENRFINDGPQHPMAHLMPPRTKPTEAQQRANDLRAAKKKKSRRIKVIAVIATVAFGTLAGPPLAAWVVDAVNESGSTTNTADNPSPDDATTDDSNTSRIGALLDDVDTLTSVVADDNATNSPATNPGG